MLTVGAGDFGALLRDFFRVNFVFFSALGALDNHLIFSLGGFKDRVKKKLI